jgi:hypothetical protein
MPQNAEYEPTLQEIAAECKRIQATWKEWQRRERAGYKDFEPVFVKTRVRVCGDGRRL